MNIIDFIPHGRANAISRRQLCNLSGLNDRLMRKEIEKARQNYAILNAQDGSGYFRPTAEEKPLVERWLRQERSRVAAIGNSSLGAEKFLIGATDGKTITVRGYTRRRNGAEPARQLEGQITL